MNKEHIEDSFEANNHNISKFRSESLNTIAQSKTQSKPINLSRTADTQFRALNLRHELNVHSQPGANRRKSASQARWRQLYSQHQDGIVFGDIGGKQVSNGIG